MKKATFIIAGIGLMLASCTKDYTCNCDGGGQIENQSYTIKAKKESEAQATCDGYDDNTGGVVTCTLQ